MWLKFAALCRESGYPTKTIKILMALHVDFGGLPLQVKRVHGVHVNFWSCACLYLCAFGCANLVSASVCVCCNVRVFIV